MILYACQLNIVWEDNVENFRRIRRWLKPRKLPPGSLLIFPEMFATGFSMNAQAIAEPADGPTSRFLRELAAEKECNVLGGIAHRESRTGIFNEAVCFAPTGRCIARYAKLHLFTPGTESQHYVGGRSLSLFRWGKLKVAVFICYDLRFPELFRLAALQGAEAFVIIANWPRIRHTHWQALLQARAIENQAYVIGVNRCGNDPKLDYAGGSVVFDPRGNTLAKAGQEESVLKVDLDASAPSCWRKEFPALSDIRTAFKLKAWRK